MKKRMAKLKNYINHYLYKFTTQAIWVLAHGYCKLWWFFRCKIRNKSDFHYFIRNLYKQYKEPVMGIFSLYNCRFLNKEVLVDDEYERSCAIKIGSVEVMYSFDKLKRKQRSNLILFDDSPKWEITKALLEMTKTSHHNATVLHLVKHRKEKESYGKNKHRKSSS